MDNHVLPYESWFISTKCQPPRLRTHTLNRSRLHDALYVALMKTPVVLLPVATGASNAAIAEQLVLSVHTVKIHVAHILSKLDVPTRTEAALRAHEQGIV